MSVSALRRPLEQIEAEIEHLKARAQAERDFQAVYPGRENPWAGAEKRLDAAKAQLAAENDRARQCAFTAIFEEYEKVVLALDETEASTRSRLAAIDADLEHMTSPILALHNPDDLRRLAPTYSLMRGAREIADFEHAKRWHTLRGERAALYDALARQRGRRDALERQHPFLQDAAVAIHRSRVADSR